MGYLYRTSFGILAVSLLLETTLCHWVDTGEEASFPLTRGQLYAGVVENLLERAKREIDYPSGSPDTDERQQVLGRLCFYLWIQNWQASAISEKEFNRTLGRVGKQRGYGSDTVRAFRGDFIHNSGLLRHDARKKRYFFLHLTFQEYLTAACLARWINDETCGWDWTPKAPGWKGTLRVGVSYYAWEPEWREVIVLLA